MNRAFLFGRTVVVIFSWEEDTTTTDNDNQNLAHNLLLGSTLSLTTPDPMNLIFPSTVPPKRDGSTTEALFMRPNATGKATKTIKAIKSLISNSNHSFSRVHNFIRGLVDDKKMRNACINTIGMLVRTPSNNWIPNPHVIMQAHGKKRIARYIELSFGLSSWLVSLQLQCSYFFKQNSANSNYILNRWRVGDSRDQGRTAISGKQRSDS